MGVAEDADLMLYGCSVASAASGQAFVNDLALLTGLDVAASVDATGHNALGGDWDLEYATGQIESWPALSDAFQDRWLTLLPTYEQFTNFTQDAELSSTSSWGQTFSHNSGLGQYSVNQISLVISQADDSTAEDITVTLRNGLDSSMIATTTIAANNLSSTYAWTEFDFGDVQLVDNLSYTIQVTSSSPEGRVYLGCAPDGYANGTLIGPDGIAVPDCDMAFLVGYVNDAPVLDNNASLNLDTIKEDDLSNSGNSVAEILASAETDPITDANVGDVQGLAITSLSSGNGTWQYSLDGGLSWSSVGTVSDTSSLLLGEVDRLRFVPDSLNGTSGSFTFRAWDQSAGSTGEKVSVANSGGTTAFSTASATGSIEVFDVNDAPVLDATDDLALAPQTVVAGANGERRDVDLGTCRPRRTTGPARQRRGLRYQVIGRRGGHSRRHRKWHLVVFDGWWRKVAEVGVRVG